MYKLILISVLFFSLISHGDGHENIKEKFTNHPNYLLSFEECKETKNGIAELLSATDSVWKEIELNPMNEKKWIEASGLSNLAANYSTIYDVWCKDMVNKRVAMRMMAKKKKSIKNKKER